MKLDITRHRLLGGIGVECRGPAVAKLPNDPVQIVNLVAPKTREGWLRVGELPDLTTNQSGTMVIMAKHTPSPSTEGGP